MSTKHQAAARPAVKTITLAQRLILTVAPLIDWIYIYTGQSQADVRRAVV